MKPYYKDDLITLYHGDARKIVPELLPVNMVYTDPIWPNCEKIFPGINAFKLLKDVAKYFPGKIERLCLHLGVDSDPRFLQAVPKIMPFFRCCWLEYVKPRYRGTALLGADILYVFGSKHLTGKGTRVISGICSKNIGVYRAGRISDHPCPRNEIHAAWVIENYSRPADVILDPFAGSGTILLAAAWAGRKVIGIEIEERWCKETVKRINNHMGLIKQMRKFNEEV